MSAAEKMANESEPVRAARYERIGPHEIHPAACVFPLIDGEAFDALCEDIKANGLKTPIVRRWVEDEFANNGSRKPVILDGRNRLRACLRVGVKPHWCDHPESEDPIKYVVSMNLARRHLNDSQRAIFAGRLASLAQGERQIGKAADVMTQAEVAALLNVPERAVRSAKRVLREAPPETIAAVERGEMRVGTAEAEIRERAEPVRATHPKASSLMHLNRTAAREERDEQVRALVEEGLLTVEEIAEKLGVQKSTVAAAKKRLGLTAHDDNPLRAYVDFAEEFTDAWEDALSNTARIDRATPEQRAELRDRLKALATTTRKFINRLNKEAGESEQDQ